MKYFSPVMAKTTNINTDKKSYLFPDIICVKEEIFAIPFVFKQDIWGEQIAMTFLGGL